MELRHLKSFVVLAEELHFGSAAKRLHIVQPALSKQMQLLEETVGCRLLNRNRRGVALSEAGKVFLEEVNLALEHVACAIEAARRVGKGQLGRVRIGYSASAVHSGILASALARIEATMPEVDVLLQQIEPWEQEERLKADKVDFVFGPVLDDARQALRVHHLAELPVVAGMSSSHALAAKSVIGLEDLKNEVFIEFANSEDEGLAVVKSLIGLHPQTVIAKSDPIAVLALVQARRGICVLPSVLQLPNFPQVIYKPLTTTSTIRLSLISRRDDDDPLLRQIEEILIAPASLAHDRPG
ncbi:LysR family transcriptional regulator (plasmid) [Escherichia coli]|uniref:LysR substrate-binding domain-containing protein n=1 Tax=Enterobacteriaceae TaxID=543 RepID=UPI001EF89171|nr:MULTISPECIES: LysR substrate-binding domain-containing protein [Enterobacteriaceae]ULK21408.1 LysR family transcriptional regulator [Klebsiella pneumoniae]UMU52005.1 LysR family transcriptional regulator [Klebsiella quasipneumoniae]UMU56908.1 LysR family transcriptional regulator [Escherichia coli]UMV03880.1 LysR family transcriptional regulator [Shigella flexneri]UMV11895.1 LysR family transcriptional regulator [Escherichia coli]